MSYHNEIAGIYEPSLVEIFDRLNSEVFDGKLPTPDALAYDYRPSNRRGGQIYYRYSDGHCYYIVVRGKQKDNPKNVELTMLHEMCHLSLIVQFFESDLRNTNYRIKDFVKDKSGTFILELAKAAIKYGCTFRELECWSDEDSPDKETTITSKKYNESQSAKSLLATLSQGGK